MDSNGEYNSNKKEFSYTTINQEQSNLVLQLISSMGIKTQVNQKTDRNTKKVYYEITFNCNFNPFYAREVNVDIKEKNSNNLIIIKNVEECDTVPTRCIEVDSPTHTFLYGNQFMVTHNTNKDLYKNFASQKLLPPFDGLLDMPLSVYKLQLSLYENALTKIGMKVVGRRILWLKPDCSYEKIPLESYRERIDNELKKLYN